MAIEEDGLNITSSVFPDAGSDLLTASLWEMTMFVGEEEGWGEVFVESRSE